MKPKRTKHSPIDHLPKTMPDEDNFWLGFVIGLIFGMVFVLGLAKIIYGVFI